MGECPYLQAHLTGIIHSIGTGCLIRADEPGIASSRRSLSHNSCTGGLLSQNSFSNGDSDSQDAIPHYVVDVLDYAVLRDLKAPLALERACSGDVFLLRVAPYDLTIWDSDKGPQLMIGFFNTAYVPVIVGLGVIDTTLRKAEPVHIVDSPQSHRFRFLCGGSH